ncbi:MAG: putative transcriptional regulator [Candidatus Methanohalarchaeum thermophilum]|uniref:Transcriptional regulator n=1 Tax=Methanohalarchaeum thermophilum TaxID=1903181 RepID=A0A1Q6DTB7_METT1|nr:MAG: putative transcriptional regulator [Candidatus Methanohalarchaeum thermophilum]
MTSVVDTKFRVLKKVAKRQPRVRQVDIAKELDLTPQAVSEHIKLLKKDNLIERRDKGFIVTKKGIQWLINESKNLREFSEDIEQNIVKQTPYSPIAIAEEDIEKGDKVGIFMKEGLLRAEKGEKSAYGYAETNAEEGEEIEITKISGIVDLEPGKILAIEVPSPKKGGSEKLKSIKIEFNEDKIAATDESGYIAAKKTKREPDIIFGAKEAIIDAALKGLNVLAFGTKNAIEELVKETKEMEIEIERHKS